MKKVILLFASFILVLSLYLIVSGQWVVVSVLYHNFADLDDYKIFPNDTVSSGSYTKKWQFSSHKITIPDSIEGYLAQLNTKALLIIKDDKIIYEKYGDDSNDTTIFNSFSMAKSYVSSLVGIALGNGKIKSLDMPIATYLPEFAKGNKSKITIRYCLTMSSGLDWDESYQNPLSDVSKAYYGDDLTEAIHKLNLESEPGKTFRYKGADTQILAMVLEKIYAKSLSKILSDELWKPLGANKEALWSLDNSQQNTKASCCLFAVARDFALLGLLYLNNGVYNNTYLLDSNYIKLATSPINLNDAENTKVDYYGYQWWLIKNTNGEKVYYARGVGGQYLVVLPSQNTVFVRLGEKRGERYANTFKELIMLVNFLSTNSNSAKVNFN